MSDEQETAEIAVYNASRKVRVSLDDLRVVSPYIWYCGPDDTPMTPIETPAGPMGLPMPFLIVASRAEHSPEAYGYPAGTQLRPPVRYFPAPGHFVVGFDADTGGIVTAIPAGRPETTADRINHVLAEGGA